MRPRHGRSSSSPSTATTTPTRRATRCCSTPGSGRRCSTRSTARRTPRSPTTATCRRATRCCRPTPCTTGSPQRPGLHLRPGEGRPDAHRGRLQDGQRGYRTTKQGKPFTLRLYTDAQTPENVTTSKLVMGWFKQVGVRVRLPVLDPGALEQAMVNYRPGFAPAFDMVVWWWQGDPDPQFILSLLTPSQVGGWSDTSWTDPRYTKLFGRTEHGDRPAAADRPGPADAADRVSGLAVPDLRLPRGTAGLRHRRLAGLREGAERLPQGTAATRSPATRSWPCSRPPGRPREAVTRGPGSSLRSSSRWLWSSS